MYIHGYMQELRLRESLPPMAQIDVSFSDVRDQGLCFLVDALLEMKTSLLVLKAAKANLTEKSGETLRLFLQECNDLEELWLGGNKVTAKGLALICDGLSEHPNMELLDISSCEIGAPGGMELGALLARNKTLKIVDCSWNLFSGEDSRALLEYLCLNSTVEEFRASWNSFGKAALKELKVLHAERKGPASAISPSSFYELDLRNCGDMSLLK